MTEVLVAAAGVVAGLGLVSAAATFLATRRPMLSLGVLLDLLLAAGLLRLAAVDDWPGIIAAAAVVSIRKVVTLSYRRGSSAPSSAGSAQARGGASA